jgi:hypothetical protein
VGRSFFHSPLSIEGRIDFSKYEGLRPSTPSTTSGYHRRAFTLSNRINQNNIGAEMQDVVLTLVLPKGRRPNRGASTSVEGDLCHGAAA